MIWTILILAAGVLLAAASILLRRKLGRSWMASLLAAGILVAACGGWLTQGQLAQRQHLPAYVIFTNASLTEMAEKRPRTTGDFLRISGVGDARARRYGMEFLRVIAEYQREHPEE